MSARVSSMARCEMAMVRMGEKLCVGGENEWKCIFLTPYNCRIPTLDKGKSVCACRRKPAVTIASRRRGGPSSSRRSSSTRPLILTTSNRDWAVTKPLLGKSGHFSQKKEPTTYLQLVHRLLGLLSGLEGDEADRLQCRRPGERVRGIGGRMEREPEPSEVPGWGGKGQERGRAKKEMLAISSTLASILRPDTAAAPGLGAVGDPRLAKP
ncbi:unnamed protein product [Protopolystoma xenopodis]|uniref:Uncharacterized protein n=1 Tax=Protopolystoma xenopodis TaxID=117903 RepID=A0A3S5ALG3_9PLAT|nr:unnamed protein product [Protopolystoma xenopodis]